jgi:dipeptidyl aminopeptidase/acylaminoacyl peptidase
MNVVRRRAGGWGGLVAGLALALTVSAAEPVLVESSPCFPEATYEEAVAAEKERETSWSRETFDLLTAPVDGEPACRRLVYRSDGLRVVGYQIRPVPVGGASPGPAPVIVFLRGGNRDFGRLTRSSLFSLARFARHGYVLLAPQYRGVDGGEGRDEFGGAEVADVLALADAVREMPFADPGRIGLFGWSRGGMTAFQALARDGRFRAAVVGGAATDAFATLEHRPPMERVFAELVPGWPEDREAALTARSAVRWADRLPETTPVLLLHGGADDRVEVSQSLDMARALHEAGRDFRLVVFEGGDHGLTEHREEVDEQVMGWFDRHL